MKKLLLTFLYCIVLIFGNVITIPFSTNNIVNAEKEIPRYAKWGKLAIRKTKEKYPNAKIMDYLHIGRDEKTKSSIEKFKLWLKEKEKEFGGLVEIEFDTETEQIIDITFKEVPK
jgi:hypothetical protein